MRVFARLGTKIGDEGYRDYDIYRVENFAIDSALDTDTDTWSCDIGDPAGRLIDILRRDTEVRVSLFRQVTTGERAKASTVQMNYGIADTIGLTHDGRMSITGRDITAIAVDSTPLPKFFYKQRPEKIVTKQATELGLTKLALMPGKLMGRVYTDGSESYWEFWYRLYRSQKMWLWGEPNGTLKGHVLNYGMKPIYFFGSPRDDHPSNKKQYIPVISAEIRKSTTSRVFEVLVFGDDGKIGFNARARDSGMREWIKKPRKIILDSNLTGESKAREQAFEELFEGKVGSVEMTVVIQDPGFPILQNRIARLHLPTIGYHGDFFVVGTRVTGGTGGFQQEVRLREKQFALTRRVPDDPELADTPTKSSNVFGVNLHLARENWGDYFYRAAKRWHGNWDFVLFLGTMLAICEHETSFKNVRQYHPSPGPEWMSFDDFVADNGVSAGAEAGERGRQNFQSLERRYHELFANDPGNPLNPFGSADAGVGPMQLTTHSFKIKADALGGKHDEYEGGRWMPEWNIMEAGEVLRGKVGDGPVGEEQWWLKMAGYNGSGPLAEKYRDEVRDRYEKKWKGAATKALTTKLVTPGAISPHEGQEDIPDISTTKGYLGTPLLGRFLSEVQRFVTDRVPYAPAAERDRADCSGMVCYAAGTAMGIGAGGYISRFGRTTEAMIVNSNMAKVSGPAAALPGDLIFYVGGRDTPPGHMAVYIGDGRVIEESGPDGAPAQVDDAWEGIWVPHNGAPFGETGIRRLPGMYLGAEK